MKARFVYKGGKGSGDFGHSGRPGKVGGSAGDASINVQGDFVEEYAHTIQSVHKRIMNEFPSLKLKGVVTTVSNFMSYNDWEHVIEISSYWAMHPQKDSPFEESLIHEYGHAIVANIRKHPDKGEFFDAVNELMTKLPSPSEYADRRGRSEWIPERFLLEFTGKEDKVLIPLMHKYL